MKTILWKELREHARWTPLGIIPVVIVLVLKWQSDELIFDASRYGNSLRLTSLVSLIAASIALCLGLIQSWPDQRPAARALLLHRGITANAAFGGKLLAGILLYAVAVFLPLSGMAVFIASVGIENRAASPSSMIPPALIAIAAFSCWPAGLLTAQRNAWFFGSRLLPGFTAAMAVLACGALMDLVFWLAIVIGVATLSVYLVVAHSVFVNSGQNATGVGRAGLALAVTVATLTIVLSVGMSIESYRVNAAYARVGDSYHQYIVEFGPDGSPWLTRSHYSSSYKYEVDQVAKMVPDHSVRDQLQPVPDDWKTLRKWSSTGFGSSVYSASIGKRFESVSEFSVPSGSEYVHRAWVHDRKLDVILVYAIRQRSGYRLEETLLPPSSIGSFGEMQNFGVTDPNGNFVLVTSTGVFRVPGNGSEVETIYALPKGSRLLGSEFLSQTNPQADVFGLMLRFRDRVVLLETDHDADSPATSLGPFPSLGVVFASRIRLPEALATADMIKLARHPDGGGFYVGLADIWPQTKERSHWLRFAADGRIAEERHYTVGPTTPVVETGNGILALIPPSVFAFGVAMIAIEDPRSGGLPEAWEEAKSKPADTAVVVLLCLVQPALGILLALWAARRRGLDKSATRRWLGWAFLFGPCGSLTILAVYPRVVRESCNACRKVTRIDVANCEHCGHSLDEEAKNGIEIFDKPHTALVATTQPAAI